MRRVLMSMALILGPSTATASPILINGSFELGPAMNGSQDVDIVAGSVAVPGWTVFGTAPSGYGVIDYLGPSWDVSDGQHAIDLDGRLSISSGVSQTFATTLGQAYLVSFDLSGNPQGGPTLKQMQVSVGNFSQAYSFDATGLSIQALTWQTIAFSFVATGNNATLTFTSLTPTANSYGAIIDNVSVSAVPVPEPTTLVLMSAALIGVIGKRLIRRRPCQSEMVSGAGVSR